LVIREGGPVSGSLQVPDRLLDVKEAAALLNVPESWIYQHVRARAEDQLPHFKVGKYIRFSAQALTQWLEAHRLGGETASLVTHGGYFQERRG
jgi:excisionase family DNA binding protein